MKEIEVVQAIAFAVKEVEKEEGIFPKYTKEETINCIYATIEQLINFNSSYLGICKQLIEYCKIAIEGKNVILAQIFLNMEKYIKETYLLGIEH